MNDVPRRKQMAARDLGVPGLAAAEPTAFSQKSRPGCPVDRAIHPSTAEKRGICRIDDRVDVERRYVGLGYREAA
jgi:hypothetical protein